MEKNAVLLELLEKLRNKGEIKEIELLFKREVAAPFKLRRDINSAGLNQFIHPVVDFRLPVVSVIGNLAGSLQFEIDQIRRHYLFAQAWAGSLGL